MDLMKFGVWFGTQKGMGSFLVMIWIQILDLKPGLNSRNNMQKLFFFVCVRVGMSAWKKKS